MHCILAARENEAGMVADQLAQCGYTHHQKTIICDTTNKDGTFSVEAFIGGLDIHSGRYDTPEFPLFKTLQTLHANDFIQKCFPGSFKRLIVTFKITRSCTSLSQDLGEATVLQIRQVSLKQNIGSINLHLEIFHYIAKYFA